MNDVLRPHATAANRQFHRGAWRNAERAVAEEAAIAFVIDGSAEAVMMATPADLEDFAFGFALSEGLAATAADIEKLDIVADDQGRGVEVRLWLRNQASRAHAERRRRRFGPAGCGLCGVESIDAALRPLPEIASDVRIEAAAIIAAMRTLAELQPLNQATRAVHAAAYFCSDAGLGPVREDVGRHNALDKLIGALTRAGQSASEGVVLMTSRVSVELVQKAAIAGAPILAAISAPTALALRTAEATGICVCGVVRDDGLEVFTHAERIAGDAD